MPILKSFPVCTTNSFPVMSILIESNAVTSTICEDFVFAPLPMKQKAKPTLSDKPDSKHKWKLTLHKQDGSKLIRFASTKAHALNVGRAVHESKNRPTKMFSIQKV